MEQKLDDVFVPLYQQLRAVAQARLAGNTSSTLQATAVVHEALMRLAGKQASDFVDEHHLLASAAQAIRHVIVDHARRKNADKRNGGRTESLHADDSDSVAAESLMGLSDPRRVALMLDVDRALDALETEDQDLRVIVELHTFAGMTHEQIAALMGSSERTIRRRWQFAAALLRKQLVGWEPSPDAVQAE